MTILSDPTRLPVPIRCPAGHRLATATGWLATATGWVVRGKSAWPMFIGPLDPIARPADGPPDDPTGGLLTVAADGGSRRPR